MFVISVNYLFLNTIVDNVSFILFIIEFICSGVGFDFPIYMKDHYCLVVASLERPNFSHYNFGYHLHHLKAYCKFYIFVIFYQHIQFYSNSLLY